MTADDLLRRLSDANPIPDPEANVDAAARDLARRAAVMSPSQDRRRTPRFRKVARFSSVAVATATVLAVGLLASGRDDGSTGLAGPALALANVLDGPDTILHTVRSEPPGVDASGGPAILKSETWSMLDRSTQGESVHRSLTTYADGTFQDLRHRIRKADNPDGEYQVTVYWSKRNELHTSIWRKVSPLPASATDTEQLSLSRVQNYADAVKAGNARLDGETEIRGQRAIRVIETTDGPSKGTVWFVSKDAKTPALLRIEYACPMRNESCPSIDFTRYELSKDTSKLEMPEYPGANRTTEADYRRDKQDAATRNVRGR